MTVDTGAAMQFTVRRLSQEDLERAVAIDRDIVGHSRRGYFEKRLAAALRDPEGHIQFGIDGESGLEAFVLSRVLQGEFGRDMPAVVLEVIDVAPSQQHHGHGAALLDALEAESRNRGIDEIQTSIVWTDHIMARFFGEHGFRKARRQVIGNTVEEVVGAILRAQDANDDPDSADDELVRADNAAALPRNSADVSSLEKTDLDAIVSIDRKLTGRDRHAYMTAKIDEALMDSDIRVSLMARLDGLVTGFLMARLDFGDFGRAAPVAVIDTIGVHPDFTGRGIAHALLSQLLANLRGLRVERVETTVALDDFDLLGFLYSTGFEPTQRIALTKKVA